MTPDKASAQRAARRILDPVAAGGLRLGLSPDALTLIGLALSIAAGVAVATGRLYVATLLLFLGALCDILDGSMARRAGCSSRRGAFLDSTLDRLAEIAVFIGLVVYFRERLFVQVLTLLALTGSLMTSYARARAEGLGIDCKVGLLERPERLALLILGLLLAPLRLGGLGLLEWVIALLALLTYVTTLQRILHVLGRTAALDAAPARSDSARSPR